MQKRQRKPAGSADLDSDASAMTEDILSGISVEELREFLEADLFDVPVNPEFKEALRRKLWDLVQSRSDRTNGGGGGEGSGPH